MSRRFPPSALLLLALAAAAPAAAAGRLVETIEAERVEPQPPLRPLPHWTAPGRPTVALALSGGGSRGLAHLGVLEALAEAGIEVDAIAGSSAGALVGGLHAAGYSPEEIADLIRLGQVGELLHDLDGRRRTLSRGEDLARSSTQLRLRRRRGDDPATSRPGGLLAARKLDRELQRLLLLAQAASGDEFDRLALRFRPVVTDLVSGRKVAPRHGQLAPLVTGSATVPGLVAPVALDGMLLVDGGLRENVPVETARSLRTDVVVAVDVSQGVDPERELGGPLDVLDRSLDIVMDAKTQESLGKADAVLRPEVTFAARTDMLAALDDLVAVGRRAVADRLDDLTEVLSDLSPDRTRVAADRVELRGTTRSSAAELERRLGLDERREVLRWRVAGELARMLNREAFASARAELWEEDGERVLRFVVEELPAPAALSVTGRAPDVELALPADLSWPALRAAAWPLRRESLRNGDAFAHLAGLSRGAETVIEWSRSEVREARAESEDVKLRRASRRVAALTGERFDYDRLAFRLDELAARGLVRRWRLEAAGEPGGGVKLTARLEPDRPDELGVGVAYRGDLSWAGQLELSRANLRGSGEALRLRVAAGEEVAGAELHWDSPYGFGLRTTGWQLGAGWKSGFVPSVRANQHYEDFDASPYESLRSWAGLVHRAGRRRLEGGLLHEHRKLPLETGGPGSEHERTALYLDYSVDGQDRLLFPSRGGRFEVHGDAAIAGDQLWRLEAKGAWALPLTADAGAVWTARAGAGVSGQADHPSFWHEPGGHAALYGWVPHGARSPQYLRAGWVLRHRLLARKGAELHAEVGADWLRTALERDDLEDADDVWGWGLSVTATVPWFGPLTLGWSANDEGGDVYWVTAGFPFLDP